MYLVYVLSRITGVQPWYQRISGDLRLWRLCGFKTRPTESLVHARFAELERYEGAFRKASETLMSIGRSKDKRVGAWWNIDGTEAEAHAVSHHDCKDGEGCPDENKRLKPRMTRVDVSLAKALRQARATEPAEDSQQDVSVEGLKSIAIDSEEVVGRNGRRYRAGNHWWFCSEPDAGLRTYSRRGTVFKSWLGYLAIEVVDHFTQAPVASVLIPANRQEEALYEEVFAIARQNLGGVIPFSVCADAGYAYDHIYRHNSNLGVTTVTPYRRRRQQDSKRRPTTIYCDSQGTPSCRHCGRTDTVRTRFAVQRGKGRIWFRCKYPDCGGEQTVLCDMAPQHLLPIERDELAFKAMQHMGRPSEQKHQHLRSNYQVGPVSYAIRPKRKGIACQQLRATAAMVIDWLRVLHRAGWLGTPTKVDDPIDDGAAFIDFLERLKRQREAADEARRLRRAQPGSPAPPRAA
ncbi:MAG: hypothetical protein ACREOD_07615 [Candidatus Dormibacteria bacterium]